MSHWFEYFFDKLYYETYRVFENEERNESEARFIVDALGILPGSRVLDLGCGYGRHTVYLAKWGYRVVCYDLSEYLLSKARERIENFNVEGMVEIVRGDMRELMYESEFDGIYIFFTTFGYFGDEGNFEVLRRVSKALKEGGKLLLDLWNPVRVLHNAFIYNGSRRTWYEAGKYVVLEETVYDVMSARVNSKRIFYSKDDGRKVGERTFSIRFYTYWELRRMLKEVGLTVTKAYGSYDASEYRITNPRMITVSEKRGGVIKA